MHANTVLIIYSSRHGHTARIAHRLRDALLAGGVAVVDSPVAEADAPDPARFDGVVVGRRARIRRAIIDKDVRVPAGFEIGWDRDADRARGFTVSDEGVTVVAKGEDLERFG